LSRQEKGRKLRKRKEMAEKDSLTEESKWLIELLRLLWVTLFVIIKDE